MRHLALGLLLVLGMEGMGCAWLFGSKEGEKSKAEEATSIISPIMDRVIPGSGAILAAVVAAIAEARRRKAAAAVTALATGINVAREMKDPVTGNISEEKLMAAQVKEQERLKVRTYVCKLVDKLEEPK